MFGWHERQGRCHGDRAECTRIPHRQALARPRSTEGVEATSLLSLVQMVDSGLGIKLLPEMAIRGGLTESPLEC